MKSALALFSQPGAFGSFVGTKEQELAKIKTEKWEAGASGRPLFKFTPF
tara:strand:+ start:82330 stop:82476 length:147 start_codon:yes stop_codon:yes gene_type:complete